MCSLPYQGSRSTLVPSASCLPCPHQAPSLVPPPLSPPRLGPRPAMHARRWCVRRGPPRVVAAPAGAAAEGRVPPGAAGSAAHPQPSHPDPGTRLVVHVPRTLFPRPSPCVFCTRTTVGPVAPIAVRVFHANHRWSSCAHRRVCLSHSPLCVRSTLTTVGSTTLAAHVLSLLSAVSPLAQLRSAFRAHRSPPSVLLRVPPCVHFTPSAVCVRHALYCSCITRVWAACP